VPVDCVVSHSTSFPVTQSSYPGGSFWVTVRFHFQSWNFTCSWLVSVWVGSCYHQELSYLKDWAAYFWKSFRMLTAFLIKSPALVVVTKDCLLCWLNYLRTKKWFLLIVIEWGWNDEHLLNLTTLQSPAKLALPVFEYDLKPRWAVLLAKNCLCLQYLLCCWIY